MVHVCNGTTFDHGKDELVIYPDHLSSLALVIPSPGYRTNGNFDDWLESRNLTVFVDHVAADEDVKIIFLMRIAWYIHPHLHPSCRLVVSKRVIGGISRRAV